MCKIVAVDNAIKKFNGDLNTAVGGRFKKAEESGAAIVEAIALARRFQEDLSHWDTVLQYVHAALAGLA
jgi:hypothetical protein